MKENISIHNRLVKSINEDFITNHTNVHTSLSDKILSLEKENKNFKKKDTLIHRIKNLLKLNED